MTSQQAILLPRPPKCCATTLQDTSPFHMTSASEHSQKTPRFLRVALCLYTLYSDKSRTMQTKSSQTSPVPNSTLDSTLVCQTPKCHCSSCSFSQSDCYTQHRPSRALHTTASLSCQGPLVASHCIQKSPSSNYSQTVTSSHQPPAPGQAPCMLCPPQR